MIDSSKILSKYTNFKNAGSFSSAKAIHDNNKDLKLNQIEKTLSTIPAYSLHKKTIKNFEREKTFVPNIDDTWQIDLIDVSKLKNKKYKQNFNFILMVLDCFSRKAWAKPIKSKHASETADGILKIFRESKRKPKRIYSDEGKEFMGSFKNLLQKEKIQQIFTKSIHKASMVERLNRTIKSKIYRAFTFRKNKIYIDILDDIIESYNNTYHRSIKTTPNSVNKKNEKNIFDLQYKNIFSLNKVIKIKFKLGSFVRKIIEKKLFFKGYTPNWSSDVYIISKILPKDPIRYEINTISHNKKSYKVNKQFYENELQLVNHSEFPYDVYKIIDTQDDQILVKQINDSQENNKVWYNKKEFENESSPPDT